MEYSDNRIETCSCIFRDDSDTYICGTRKDETQVCIGVLAGHRSSCSSLQETKYLDCRTSQDITLDVCDTHEEEEQKFDYKSFIYFEEEKEEFEEEEEEIQEEWKSESLKQAEVYLKKHRIKDLLDYMNSCLLTCNPGEELRK